MEGKVLYFLFLAFVGISSLEPPTYEQQQNAVSLDLEFDPGFQRKFPFLSQPSGSTRIVGGVESVPNSRPYQAGMYIQVTETGFGFCGGVLLNARTVVTAAHCVDILNGSLTIHLGAHRMPPLPNDTRVVTVVVGTNEVYIHQNWSRNGLLNDIALVRFNTSVPLNDAISPILLPPDASHDYLRNQTLVSGWGRPSDQTQLISPVLREATLVIMSNYPCRLAFLGIVQPSNICASGAHGRGSCNGDSGGPLVLNGHLIGVVSFGSVWGCEQGYPSVYARVTYYLDWIRSNLAVVPTTNDQPRLNLPNDYLEAEPDNHHVAFYE